MKRILTFFLLIMALQGLAQVDVDTVKTKQLKEVVVMDKRIFNIEYLSATQGTYMLGGKKNEVINVQNMDVNISEKTPRQIFSKVPGIFVYDMDGSGNQTNISTRGLDPHRGWEYNIRKNGIITNSDMYGYPASHYSMPMEAVDHIEMVRGTGSLQFGAQFGGMLNYVSKSPDTLRAITFESVNSVGSFNMLSTFNAVSGTIGKFQYYAYFNKRVSDGYRENGHTDFDAQSVTLIYNASKNVQLKTELSRSNYVYQIPGPLTDSMFHADPKQSTRSRNYFNPEIYVPSLSLDWSLGARTKLLWVVSAVLGVRNSVQFDKLATVSDVINPTNLTYAARQVDVDHFNSYTSELRLLHQYTLGNVGGTLVGGVQVFNNDLHRQQLGKGTTGTDFDLTLTDPAFGRDMHLKTKNFAFFIENSFLLAERLTITPGIRMETGKSDMTGVIANYDAASIPNTIKHNFPLLGLSINYETKNGQRFYAGWSQAYRPVIFKDIIPSSVYEVVDKNLKDATGYNLEAGYRGSYQSLRWDVGVFSLQYKNRLGSLEETNSDDGTTYIFRTNIGNSITNGAEIFIEYNFKIQDRVEVSLFTSTALFDGHYTDAEVKSGKNAGGSSQSENINISGNKIESVPDLISRNGLTIHLKPVSLTVLYSYTAKSYADALNTVTPSKSGAVGLVPSYGIVDVNASIRLSSQLLFRVNINNISDKQYFTKRPQFYPGPGVWSSDGRSINCSVALKI